MTEPTPPPSKLQLLVARTDEGFSVQLLLAVCLITYMVYLHVVKNIPLRYLFEIVHLSRYAVVILDRHSK